MFRTLCVDGMQANAERCKQLLDESLCLATGLSPYLGYKVTAQLVKDALNKGKTLKEELIYQNFMGEKDLDKILDPAKLTAPSLTDRKLIEKILKNPNYKDYLRRVS
jgi:aspartate ammonia-lyase